MTIRKTFFAVVAVAAAAIFGACDRGDAIEDGSDFAIGICHTMAPGDLEIVRALGANSVRNTMRWRDLEPDAGRAGIPESQLRLEVGAKEIGLNLLTPISYGNPHFDEGSYPESNLAVDSFARAAAFAAVALKNPQPVLEIWNEWNLGIGMPAESESTPEAYVRLQTAAYAAIKAVRQPPVVLGGSMAGAGLTDDWLEKACGAGMLKHLDGLSFHPYCYWMGGRASMPERGMLELVHRLEEIVDRFPGGSQVPLYLTEMGWPTHEGPDGVSLDEQAQYVSRALLLARAHPRIKGIWWFNLRDKNSSSGNFEHRFGLMFSDGTPKPAYFAFRDTAQAIRPAMSSRHQRLGGTVHAVWLELADGSRQLALWVAKSGVQSRIEISGLGEDAARSLLVGTGSEVELQPVDGRLTVSVGNMPVILRKLPQEAQIAGHSVTGVNN